MSYSVIDNYLKTKRKNINEYMKKILQSKYNKNICDKFIDKYFDHFYYETYASSRNSKKKYMKEILQPTYEALIEDEPTKKKNIDLMYEFFDYPLVLEKLDDYSKINDTLKEIEKLRKEKLDIEEDNFSEEFIKLIDTSIRERHVLLDSYSSKEFTLKKVKINRKLTKVKLKHNIRFPLIYSNIAIEKVFNSGLINEDKLMIEYMQVSADIINDIENGVYNHEYIVEFADTLLEKQQKINRVLEIIQNEAIQNRVSLKITYQEFASNKEVIYDLINNGFKFALIIDKTFEYESSKIPILTLFSYILIDKNLACYEKIILDKNVLKNIIEL